MGLRKFDYSKLPIELKEERRFVVWGKKDSNNRVNKIPYCPITDLPAKSNDSSTWATFKEAIDRLEKDNLYSGIGFMLGDGFAGIDLDDVLPKEAGVVERINKELNTYCETSQSGNGVHFLFKLSKPLPKGSKRKGNYEFYDNRRYIALTGQINGSDKINDDINEKVFKLYNEFLYNENDKELFNKGLLSKSITDNPISLMKDNKLIPYSELVKDEEAILRCICSSKQKQKFLKLYQGDINPEDNHSSLDLSLCNILAFWFSGDVKKIDTVFRKSALMRPKWDRPIKEGDSETYGQRTINKACNDLTNYFKNTGIYNNTIFNQDINEDGTVIRNIYKPTERGMAQFFVDTCSNNIAYVIEEDKFIYFSPQKNKWVFDNKDHNRIKTIYNNEFLKEYDDYLENDNIVDTDLLNKSTKFREKMENAFTMKNIITQIPTLRNNKDNVSIVVSQSQLDSYPYLLNCKNGVVDLRNGILYPKETLLSDGNVVSNKRLYFTHGIKYNYHKGRDCPKWKKFMLDICKGRKELADFLKRALGYTMSGETGEQVFFECYGDGGNGKSVLFNIIFEILGDYATTTQINTILASKNGGTGNNATPEIAKLQGKRFLKTSEPDENAKLKEGQVKDLTGGETISARQLYGESFTFKPEFKLWIGCNYKFRIIGRNNGIWRRTIIIPFDQKFVDPTDKEASKDKDALPINKKLEFELIHEEAEGILNWLIEGAIEWYKSGLKIPSCVDQETQTYRKEQDIFNRFIEDELTTSEQDASLTDKDYITLGEMWTMFKEWCKESNETNFIRKQKFSKELQSPKLLGKMKRLTHGYAFVKVKKGKFNEEEALPF